MTLASDDDEGGGALARAVRERDAALAEVRRLSEACERDAREAVRHLRNILSVVRVLAHRTADAADSVEDFRAVFDGRLAAFARGQSAGERCAGRDLGAIIGDELLGFGLGVGDGVELAGAPVRLASRAAGLVALAMHELVSGLAANGNAGPVRVIWNVGDVLDIDWIEPAREGADPVPLPYWVDRAIAYELKGELSEGEAGGELRRRIRLPRAVIRGG